MKSKTAVLGSATVAAAVLLSGSFSSANDPSAGSDADRPDRVIRLVERVHVVDINDRGDPGLGVGDRLVFSSDLFDRQDRKVGIDGADCVVVRVDSSSPAGEQQIVNCVITVELADGEITFQGLAQGTSNLFAVTGGTGAYRTARGEALAEDRVPLQVADITIRLFL